MVVAGSLTAIACTTTPVLASTFARTHEARVFEFGSRPRRGEAPTSAGTFLSTGYARPVWLFVKLAGFFRRGGNGDGLALSRDDGRRVCEFPIGEPAAGLFVRVKGRVEFERAMIGFADGRIENVEAFGLERTSGVFQLAGPSGDASVEWVRLVLRARTPKARVRVLVGR